MKQCTPYDLEEAAFAAWPCLHEERIDGWRLRFARGFTKRANSVNADEPVRPLLQVQLGEIESRYAREGLTPVFRLISDETGRAMDRMLHECCYRLVDPSLVMTCVLDTFRDGSDASQCFKAEDWLSAFHSVSAKADPLPDVHLSLLRAMPLKTAFMVVQREGLPAACGIAVVTGRLVGLFEIATRPALRGRRLAEMLCRDLLAWGRSQGADTAYLQVDGQNLGAIALYERLGFSLDYEYWYRVKAQG